MGFRFEELDVYKECIPLLEISKMQGYINTADFDKLYERCNILAKRLNALKNSIREP
jgi:hypothetical protein